MTHKEMTFEEITEEISAKKEVLESLRDARNRAKWYLRETSPIYEEKKRRGAISAQHRRFKLLAQGDSWFDYFNIDIINQMNAFGHECHNIAVAG